MNATNSKGADWNPGSQHGEHQGLIICHRVSKIMPILPGVLSASDLTLKPHTVERMLRLCSIIDGDDLKKM